MAQGGGGRQADLSLLGAGGTDAAMDLDRNLL